MLFQTKLLRIKIDIVPCYIPHQIPSIPQQRKFSAYILDKTPTELRYMERSVCMKELNNRKLLHY